MQRRLAAIEKALTQKPLSISDVNKALKQAVQQDRDGHGLGHTDVSWHHPDLIGVDNVRMASGRTAGG